MEKVERGRGWVEAGWRVSGLYNSLFGTSPFPLPPLPWLVAPLYMAFRFGKAAVLEYLSLN